MAATVRWSTTCEVLRILNALPSLDPFLLREHLRGHGIDCAECYFEISPADRQRMHDYVAREIRKLIELATGGGGGASRPTRASSRPCCRARSTRSSSLCA